MMARATYLTMANGKKQNVVATKPARTSTGSTLDVTMWLKDIYIDTAKEHGYTSGPGHFGYLLKAFVADTDEKALEIGRQYMWTDQNRMKGPPEHNDPPGYQSREALRVKRQRPVGQFGGVTNRMTYEQQQDINIVIVGSPETVTRKLTQTLEKLDPGYLHIYGNEGAMPRAYVMRSIELMGKEVIPALHEIKLQPYE